MGIIERVMNMKSNPAKEFFLGTEKGVSIIKERLHVDISNLLTDFGNEFSLTKEEVLDFLKEDQYINEK